jgi:DNA-binding response OmpR family regulator
VKTFKGTALVIESQDLARDSLCEFLRDEEYEVHEAPSGLAAMRLIVKVPFDVVLAELMLPNAQGVMMLKRVREAAPHSRLIVMTADTAVETLCEITGLGAHYVQKPILFDDIVAALRAAPKPTP